MNNKTRLLGSVAIAVSAALLLPGCQPASDSASAVSSQQQAGNFERTEHGVVVYPSQGQAQAVQVQVYRDNIFRVTSLAHKQLDAVAESIQVVASPNSAFDVSSENGVVTLSASGGKAQISLVTGAVEVFDASGKSLLKPVNSGEFGPVTTDPITPEANSYALRQQWNRGSKEGFFGLGQHQNGQMNYAGENLFMTTHNLEITIPMVVSNRNYGVLWDNASMTHFGDPAGPQPLDKHLTLFDEDGNPGGLTAYYYDGDKLLHKQKEAKPDYQFLANNNTRETPFPEELGDVTQPRVVWKGSLQADADGEHLFKMYSSGYATLRIDGEELLHRWRMNWNPWYHDVKVPLKAGESVPVEMEWDSQGGYFYVEHMPPQPEQDRYSLSFASESGKSIDYYVVVADNYDGVVAGYRELTGEAVLLPKWAYGFWQSRERYTNQQELVDVVKEYRKRGIPLDNIVLDWSYWPQDAWGSHDFDKAHFPKPKEMVDEVHALNANIMISVWPKFYSTTDHYKELDAKGYMLNKNVNIEKNLDWIGEGYLNGFYDPYPEEAQEIFWRQIRDKLNVVGIDAWWLDASEPDIHSNLSFTKRKEIMTPMSVGHGAEYFNSYAVPNAEGVYKGERRDDGDKRSFILTRSGFGGIQRAGAAIWSGDTVPRWSNLREQIAAGLGASLAGMPNWTMDIGGFTPENHYRYTSNGTVGHFSGLEPEDVQPWQELNVRWFQFGAFVPLFRSHGQNPYREIYNIADEGSEVYNSMVYYTRLRYRLMPYIYSEAGKQYHDHNTLMRGLVMDFPNDITAINLNDQYMFGPGLLVSPVHEEGATTRDVYLPEGTGWFDFYTGKTYQGGQTITADAPLSRMPLFVKTGTILPTGPAIQTVYEQPDAPLLLTIYAGADGDYTLYEDDGKTYGYEQGAFSTIHFSWDDANSTLAISERQGEFEGMVEQRDIRVRVIRGEQTDAADFSVVPATVVRYEGTAQSVSL